MQDDRDIAAQFRHLHTEAVEQYERELREHREERARLDKLRSGAESRLDEALSSAGLDLEPLRAFEREQAATLERTLRERRPKLVDRPSQSEHAAQLRQLYYEVPHPRGFVVPPYAATLLAPEGTSLEGNPGERGNPWVLPFSPDRIRIKAGPSQGEGSGCWSGISQAVSALIWFTFVPSDTYSYQLRAKIGLHGFHVLISRDTFWTCKNAEVSVSVGIDAFQYVWHGRQDRSLFDFEYDNINWFSFYDSRPSLETTAPFRAQDRVWVLVNVTINASAKGSGTYAEINFADGQHNYIEPLMLSVFEDHPVSAPSW
jgi:hypothetical protein